MFDKNFEEFVKAIKSRLKHDSDLVMAITGEEGIGKSTLEIHTAMAVDENFDLDKNIAYMPTYQHMREKFNSLPQYSAFGVDEAIKVLHKQEWMTRLQRGIVHLYATERKQNKCSVICIPRFRDLNENFRNHRVKVWIHILKRGFAVAYLKDPDPHIQDPWNMKESYYIKQKVYGRRDISDRNIDTKLRAEAKTPNYWFDFEFPDLDKETKRNYIKLREHYRKLYKEEEEEDISSVIETKTTWLSNIIKHFVNEESRKVKEMAEISGMSERSVYNYLKTRK